MTQRQNRCGGSLWHSTAKFDSDSETRRNTNFPASRLQGEADIAIVAVGVGPPAVRLALILAQRG
jgi:hypothetical protein